MTADAVAAADLQPYIGDHNNVSPRCQQVRQPFARMIDTPAPQEMQALLDHAQACTGCQSFLMAYGEIRERQACQSYRRPFSADVRVGPSNFDLACLQQHAAGCVICLRDNVLQKIEAGEAL